ncbi:MAG: laccase domain-containing protein [Actinomycetales bacterium]|nr:laccase domain-containing protein [Actinomycetales bacterium]
MQVVRLSPGARGYFTDRTGGVSSGRWGAAAGPGGLNLAAHVGDDPGSVERNRATLERAIGVRVAWMSQVHGNVVRILHDAADSAGECDAVVVPFPGLAPGVLVADCAPVLLADESGTLLAAAHVGREGLFRGVLPALVESLTRRTGERLFAAVGPHICGRCYEVSAELHERAREWGAASTTSWGTPAVDLLAGIRQQLGGVPLEVVPGCTFEDQRWYSYRRDGVTGRFAGVAVRDADTPR